MRAWVISIFVAALIVSMFVPTAFAPIIKPSTDVPITVLTPLVPKYINSYGAYLYLWRHYMPTTHLVYESEDSGAHFLGMGEVPNFTWHYYQTYWVTSDNLFVCLVMPQFDPVVAADVCNEVAQFKSLEVGEFMTVNGTHITEYRQALDAIVAYSPESVIIVRTYMGQKVQPALGYADELMYYALSNYEAGNTTIAKNAFNRAIGMWNGTCFVDAAIITPHTFNGVGAPTDSGYCANNRIGLALFVSAVLNVPVPYSLETYLWKMQLPNGGIASLSQNGKPLGTANAETTATALLQFNTALIQRLNNNTAPYK